MKIASIFFLLMIFIACSSSPVPKGILDEFINNFASKDSSTDIKKKRSTLYEQVFKVNNTSRKEFYSSYKYYQQHPDIQKQLYDSLYEFMNRNKTENGRMQPPKPVSQPF